MKNLKKIVILSIIILIVFLIFDHFCFLPLAAKIKRNFSTRASLVINDRNNKTISTKPNQYGNYALRSGAYPDDLKKLLIRKEDKYFHYHLGINPISLVRAGFYYFARGKNFTQSTITQQLIKILLNNENNRSKKNKLKEIAYALALELHANKDEILNMYLNTAFLGNQAEGFESASRLYFDKPAEKLDAADTIRLLATLNNPSQANPFQADNIKFATGLAELLNVDITKNKLEIIIKQKAWEAFRASLADQSAFEINNLISETKNLKFTLDSELNEKIRAIAKNDVSRYYEKEVLSAAVAVIAINPDGKSNELIALIGSPDPGLDSDGYRINMALRPRAIGSTIKPFIYAKGFEKGLRPYTLVDDREYKYTIQTGFAFYPKNYDYQYRGLVDLHYALANSLNVPTVKVLEYAGLEDFNDLLLKNLEFKPVQDIGNYQLGIALGELEMDLLTLADYFTVFPNQGKLLPLKIADNTCYRQGNTNCGSAKEIFAPEYVALVNKILSDRRTGMDEFGENSNLNLPWTDYAVKTGTSREYHDSWTIGFTRDYVACVWVGKAEDAPMDKVSGASGAGAIWRDVMNLLHASAYDNSRQLDFSRVAEWDDKGKIQYGLKGDDFAKQKNLLADTDLILSPHDGDEFEFEKNMAIPLKATEKAEWTINGQVVSQDQEFIFYPKKSGKYAITAKTGLNAEEIWIRINVGEE